MRLAWIAYSATPKVASFRYRCLIPAWALQGFGHDSSFFIDERPDPGQFDALIVVKLAGDGLDEVARSFRSRGKPVFLDLCDNIFIPGYSQRRGPTLSVETAHELIYEAAGLVVPSPALERVALRHFHANTSSWVIPDAALTPGAYHAMSSWLPDRVVSAPRRDINRYVAGLRQVFSWARPGGLSEGAAQGPGRQDRRTDGAFDGDSDSQAEHLPEDTARVVWFGRHGSFHAKFGMGLLNPVLPELERIHRERPIELVVISNNRVRFDVLTHDLKAFARYETWSNERVFFELSRADLFVMPVGCDPFSMCKSANRAVLALANDVPVVASYLEALEPLRNALVIDDWRFGLEVYLLNDDERSAHLARAQAALAEHFSMEAIGRRWHGALTGELPTGASVTPGVPPMEAGLAS